MKKAANEVDRHVGTRLRMRRAIVGMSQEKLGAALDLTFQQVQKYEKGTNRISATRLRQISEILGVTIDYFYEGLTEGGAPAGGFAESVGTRYEADIMTGDGLKLLRAFHRVGDAKVRRRILDLVEAFAASSDEPAARSE